MSNEDLIWFWRKSVDQRLDAAAILLTNALKETLSVPVPRVKKDSQGQYLTGGKTKSRGNAVFQNGRWVWQALNTPDRDLTWYRTSAGTSVKVIKATKGDPPRKFEGRLRAGHTWERTGPFSRRVGTNVKYARVHEEGEHAYFQLTIDRVRPQLERLLAQGI